MLLNHVHSSLFQILVLSLWACAFATGIAVVYGIDAQGILNSGDFPSDTAEAFYNAFHRLAWGLALAWLIFACHNGYGGFIQDFLSWEAFLPLSRLVRDFDNGIEGLVEDFALFFPGFQRVSLPLQRGSPDVPHCVLPAGAKSHHSGKRGNFPPKNSLFFVKWL